MPVDSIVNGATTSATVFAITKLPRRLIMANPRYRFYIHQGNAVEGEVIGDPFHDEWVVVKPKDNRHVSVQMCWVTHVETPLSD